MKLELLESLFNMAVGQLNEIIKSFAKEPGEGPGKITPEKVENIANISICGYAIGKTYGVKLVESTKTKIDDKLLKEGLEVCEDMASKYGFSLDATKIITTF